MDFSKNILEFHTSENLINHFTQWYNQISKKFFYVNSNPNSIWFNRTLSFSAFEKLKRKSLNKISTSSYLHSCMKPNKVRLFNTKNIKKVTFPKRLCSYRSNNFISIYNDEAELNPWSKWLKMKEKKMKFILNNISISNFNYFSPLDLEFFYNSYILKKPPPWDVFHGTINQKMENRNLLPVYCDKVTPSTAANSISKASVNPSITTNLISKNDVTKTPRFKPEVSLLEIVRQREALKIRQERKSLVNNSSNPPHLSKSHLAEDTHSSLTKKDIRGRNSARIAPNTNSSNFLQKKSQLVSTNIAGSKVYQFQQGVLSAVTFPTSTARTEGEEPTSNVSSRMMDISQDETTISSISSNPSTLASDVGEELVKPVFESRKEKLRLAIMAKTSDDLLGVKRQRTLEQGMNADARVNLGIRASILSVLYEITKTILYITELVILTTKLEITRTYNISKFTELPFAASANICNDIDERAPLSNDRVHITAPAHRLTAMMASLDVHPESLMDRHVYEVETNRLFDEPDFLCGGILLTGIPTNTPLGVVFDTLKTHLPAEIFAGLRLSRKERSKLSLLSTLMPHSTRHQSVWISMKPIVLVQRFSRIIISSSPVYLNFTQDGYTWSSDEMIPIGYARGFSEDLNEAGAMSIGLCHHLTINRTQTFIILAPIYIEASKSNGNNMPFESNKGFFPTIAGIIVTTKVNSLPLSKHLLMLTKIDPTGAYISFGGLLVRGCYYDIHLHYSSIQKYKFLSEHVGKTAKLCVDITNPLNMRISELLVCVESWHELNRPELIAYYFLSNDNSVFSIRYYCVCATWSTSDFLAGFQNVVHPLPEARVARYNSTDLYCLRLNLQLASRMALPVCWTTNPPTFSYVPSQDDMDIVWNSYYHTPSNYSAGRIPSIEDPFYTDLGPYTSEKIDGLSCPYVKKAAHDLTPQVQASSLADEQGAVTQRYINAQSREFYSLREQTHLTSDAEEDECDAASQNMADIKITNGQNMSFPPPDHQHFAIPKLAIPQVYDIQQLIDELIRDNEVERSIPQMSISHDIRLTVKIDSLTLEMVIKTDNINKFHDLLMANPDEVVFLENLEIFNGIVQFTLSVDWHTSFAKWQKVMPDDGHSLLYSIISSEWLSQSYTPFELTGLMKSRQKMVLYSRWGAILDTASAYLANNATTVFGNDKTHTGGKYQQYIFHFNEWVLSHQCPRPKVDFDILSAIFPTGAPYTEWANYNENITPCQTTISLDPNETVGKSRDFSLLALYQIMRSTCHTFNDGRDRFSPLVFQHRMADKLITAWHIAFPHLRAMVYQGEIHNPPMHTFHTPVNTLVVNPVLEEFRSPDQWVLQHKDSTKKYLQTKLEPVYFHHLTVDEQPDSAASHFHTIRKI